MQRKQRLAAIVVATLFLLSMTILPLAAQDNAAQSTQNEEFVYHVRQGDTLALIATRFGTTVRALSEANDIVNPQLIYVGQAIVIPGLQAPSEPDEDTQTYVVRPGDTLALIAVRFGTTVSNLLHLNNLANPNVLFVGETIIVSGALPAAPVPAATEPPAPPPQQQAQAQQQPTTVPPTIEAQVVPTLPPPAPLTATYGFGNGIEVQMINQDVDALADMVVSLGLTWVKQEVYWKEFESTQGQIDFTALDPVIAALEARDLNILLTVSTSPNWSRESIDEVGPPDDFADYGNFVGALADHYAGQVQAYEIWSEPNLRREWNSTVHSISAESYMELLRAAYTAIKAVDPATAVISAGLAPTGFNDGVNAINDRAYLGAMYGNGLADVSDAIGAHPNGWANPPDAQCCSPAVGVLTHFEDRSFYFIHTLEDYRNIMVGNRDGSTAIWVTQFGWGTTEDTSSPTETNIFLTYTSLGEQAIYDPRGFEIGSDLGFVGPMILNNLNACQGESGSFEGCYYSLLDLSANPRPAFTAIQQLLNPDAANLTVVPAQAVATPTVEMTLPPPAIEPTAAPTENNPQGDAAATEEAVG